MQLPRGTVRDFHWNPACAASRMELSILLVGVSRPLGALPHTTTSLATPQTASLL